MLEKNNLSSFKENQRIHSVHLTMEAIRFGTQFGFSEQEEDSEHQHAASLELSVLDMNRMDLIPSAEGADVWHTLFLKSFFSTLQLCWYIQSYWNPPSNHH